jgi:hypothetical protein
LQAKQFLFKFFTRQKKLFLSQVIAGGFSETFSPAPNAAPVSPTSKGRPSPAAERRSVGGASSASYDQANSRSSRTM